MKRILSIFVLTIFLCGCSGEKAALNSGDEPTVSIMTGTPALTSPETTAPETLHPETTAPETTPPPTTTEETTVFEVPDVYEVQDFEHDYEDFDELIELERFGDLSRRREGYSGDGSVSLAPGETLDIIIDAPTSQHYNVTLRLGSDGDSGGEMAVDGLFGVYLIDIPGGDGYESVRFDSIYLSQGEHTLSFSGFTSAVELDCLRLESSSAVDGLDYSVARKPVTPEPLRKARKLYEYLRKCYGDLTFSAQQCTQGTNDEIDAIYNAVGKYPAIRFGELMAYSSGEDSGEIELALDWAEKGGIVGFSWYWQMGGSLYLENGFDLSLAVTGLDIASMSGEVLTQRYSAGEISLETLMVIDGIDSVAAQLKRLRSEKVPVLFRPLPEASTGVYWWSRDPESYLWLYRLVFDRMVNFHGLDNLIWIWNGQSAEFYPGDERCDIISLDVYPEQDVGGAGVNFMLLAREISDAKMAAVSECSVLPNPDEMSRDKAAWAFCSVFSGDYADVAGELSQKYMSLTDWDLFYSADSVVTLDEIEDYS